MAKKKINIILILVVLGLWGTVGYKTLNHRFSSDEIFSEKQNQTNNTTINQINKDTFTLEKVKRDPFLNKQIQTNISLPNKEYTNISSIKKKASSPIRETKEILNWPSITYHGYIKDTKGELVIIKIDKKIYRLRKNDLAEGIMIKKISSDSLEVDFNKNKKTIKRYKF